VKIVLTGGGSGGHFYPLIAVAQNIRDIAAKRKLLDPEIYYIGPEPFDRDALVALGIEFRRTSAGKVRRYRSVLNFLDIFKTAWGILGSIRQLFSLYPDVVFSKGGYASFPTMVAARLLNIPLVIHESDGSPGRANLVAAKWARAIGIAHANAASAFPQSAKSKIALVGHPIRKEIANPAAEGGYEFLELDKSLPTITIFGGSLGAEAINNVILDSLDLLIDRYNIVHQAGQDNVEEVANIAKARLSGTKYENHYRAFGLLNTLAIRMAIGISALIISRAGSGTIFEIASWGKPSILIPIPEDVSHDQTKNAFSYARSGAAVVLKQRNVTPHILAAEVDRIVNNRQVQKEMSEAARSFASPDAGYKMAKIVIDTALEHA